MINGYTVADYFRETFEHIEIEADLNAISLEALPTVYSIAHGSDQRAGHSGYPIVVTIQETDDEILANFSGRMSVVEACRAMLDRFIADPMHAGQRILENLDHPAPGTPSPDHAKRLAELKNIATGKVLPMPGTRESLEWLTGYLGDHKQGTATDEQDEIFDIAYGDREVAEGEATGLEPFSPAPLSMSDVTSPERREAARALRERIATKYLH